MTTRSDIEALRATRATFFTPYDRAAVEAELLAVLRAGLPDWDSELDTILRRALPLIAEHLMANTELNRAELLRGLLIFAEGEDVDLLCLDPPAIRRRLNESDLDLIVRKVQSLSLLNLGSLRGIEERAHDADSDIVDALATLAPNRQNVRVYVVAENAAPLTPTQLGAVSNAISARDASIAGVELVALSPNIVRYQVRVAVTHNPLLVSATDTESSVRAGVYAYIERNRLIGRSLTHSGLIDAAYTEDTTDVSSAQYVLNGSPRDSLTARSDYANTDLFYCPSDTTNVTVTVA